MRVVIWGQLSQTERKLVLARSQASDDEALIRQVKEIIANVRQNGDKALLEYAAKFDGAKLDCLLVSEDEYKAIESLSNDEKQAILTAIDNIRHYHNISCPKSFEFERNGAKLGKLYRPIEKVGLYIPGGTAPLVSTLLMLAIPATIAGCETKVLVTPPGKNGLVNPAILFAAKACGIDAIYKAGGAQAVAALAFGTESIPKVYKIFGPGNKYVTEAKIQVSQTHNGAALDMPAGPSEVLVIADDKANPVFVASDLLAQAEHDVAAQVILLTTSTELANKVHQEVERQTAYLSRKEIIKQSLAKSAVIIAKDLAEAFVISNQYAPEHLILQIANAEDYLPQVINAGSVFVGEWTPESVGDYASGTNHVLPTYGYAQMYSGLDVIAFMKAISFQNLSASGIKTLGPVVETLADLEGLDAHKNAVTVRLQHLNS
ncbi:histidinol dehydrogenase [Aquella oligotrophica]|uniref:Histidinol dehydrogenase n=1 Tax=Aquella oligotrophica TaxID=2067065 RepID=A0A2I7N7V7_9NEIS|nr:histidinol dehydrogenase [Aquella oligotrophica]AUR52541.1 histidinol dehydrogenase [Aquella oligotrophica]